MKSDLFHGGGQSIDHRTKQHGTSETQLLEKQRDVQRKLGRCLLLLQQYELMAKHLVAQSSVEGTTTDGFEAARADRVRTVANWTLGQIAKELAGSVFQSEARPEDADRGRALPSESLKDPLVRTMYAVTLPSETFDEFKAQLEELVLMRNALVHHFLQRFNVFIDEGCEAALAHLDSCAAAIEHHVMALKGWQSHMQEARQQHAAIWSRPEMQAFLEREFAPDPPEDIGPEHPLAVLFVQAEGAVAQNGWTLLTDAIKYIQAVAPGETPKKHKVRNWQQVFRRSRVFEVKKDISLNNLHVTVWYRSAKLVAKRNHLASAINSTLIAAPATGSTSQVSSTGNPLTASTACP